MSSQLYEYTPDQLQKILDESNSYADVLRKLGMSEHGANRTTLKKVIDEYGLDLSGINQNRKEWQEKQLKRDRTSCKPLNEVLKNGVSYNSDRLIKRLYADGYKEKCCEQCGITNWMGKEITFHLHHIDGNHNNNELSNLQVLCPNCHSQTDNFAGKGVRRQRVIPKTEVPRLTMKGVSEDGLRFYDGYGNYQILCPVCKLNFMAKDASQCRRCYDNQRRLPKISKDDLFEMMKHNSFTSAAQLLNIDRDTVSRWYKYYVDEEKRVGNIIINSDKAPDRNELKERLHEFQSFAALGRLYEVSDNTIRKWCKRYELPSRSKDLQNLTEDDWEKI